MLDRLTVSKKVEHLILNLLGHESYLRILVALEATPQRFAEIQSSLDLDPLLVGRALAFVRRGFWVVPRTMPGESGPLHVEYRIGKRGEALLASFERFRGDGAS